MPLVICCIEGITPPSNIGIEIVRFVRVPVNQSEVHGMSEGF